MAPKKLGEDSPPWLKTSTHQAFIPFDRDRGFRNVTGDSGPSPKSVTIKRNPRSRSNGIVGHVRPEIAVTMVQNTQFGVGGNSPSPACAGKCRITGSWCAPLIQVLALYRQVGRCWVIPVRIAQDVCASGSIEGSIELFLQIRYYDKYMIIRVIYL